MGTVPGEGGAGRGGDDLGVEAVGRLHDPGHDALDVDQERLHGTADDGQLLLQEVAGDRDAAAHQHLVRRAADAGHVDPAGAQLGRLGEEGGVGGGVDDRFRQGGLMPVDEDVHLVLAQDAQVHLGADRLGRAEQDVLEVGGDHRAAPAVGEGAA